MEKPTVDWRKFSAEWKAKALAEGETEQGSELYPEAGIMRAEDILEEFKTNLRKIKGQNDSQAILNEVESTILKLNELTSSGGLAPDMIETGEREEFCDFIDYWAKDAGLFIEDGDDITADWREW